MRLKGHFKDPGLFLRILQNMGRISSRCILRFSPDSIQLVIPRGTDSVEAWASLDDMNAFFYEQEYRVESNFNNQVNIEVATESLTKALRSATPGSDVTFKLAKHHNDPILVFDVHLMSHAGQNFTVSHEVLITVKRPRDMAFVKSAEEALAERNYQAGSAFPDLAELRSVADRMKAVDAKHDRITIALNQQGDLKLILDGQDIKIESKWTGLKSISDPQEASAEVRTRFRQVQVDLKAFVRFLSCQLLDYTAEVYIQNKKTATFVIHIQNRESIQGHAFAAHLMINLPSLDSGMDYAS